MDKKNKIEIFEKASIPSAFLSLAIPTVLAQIISIIYNFADTWFVGRTNNENAVAAIGIVMPVYIILVAFANLFGIGGASAIARFLGVKKEREAKHTFAFCLWGAISVSIVYAIIVGIFMKPIMYAVGGSDETYEYIRQYAFYTAVVGAIPTIVNTVFGHLVRSVGASKEASIGMSLGVIINIALDPLFMFVILPKGYEVAGAAIATLISNTIACIYFIIYIIRNKKIINVLCLSPKHVSFKYGIPSNVILVGFPAALQTTLAMVSNIFANKLILEYGTAALAGLGIAKKINTLAFNIMMGVTQGMLPFIAFNYSAKSYKRMKEGIGFTALISVTVSTLIFVFFMICSEYLNRFFINEEETVMYGTRFLRVIAIAVPLCSVDYLVNTIFQSAGKKIQSFIISVLRKGLLDVPLMFILKSKIGMMGVLWATPTAESIAIVVCLTLFIIFMRSLPKTDENIEDLKTS